MPAAVPVRVCDLDHLVLDALLLGKPLLPKLFPLLPLLRFTLAVGEEGRVYFWVLQEFLPFGG